MNPLLLNILETGMVQSADGQVVKLDGNITPEEGEFIQGIIDETKPKMSLEIGLAYGVSALFICESLARIPGAHHIIIDPAQFDDRYWKGIGLHNLKAAGHGEMIEFYNLPSHIALPKLESEGCQVEFAFVDGAHQFDYVLVDFFCLDKILKVGGIVVFDDVWMPSIQKVCHYVATNRSYKIFRYLPRIPGKNDISWKRRLFKKVANSFDVLGRAFRPEYVEPEIFSSLGLFNRCVAFQKVAADNRPWDFHRNF